MQYYRRLKSESIARKVECSVVTPSDCKTLCHAMEVSDLKGGLWVPGDGVANPYEICLALSHLAAQKGVKIVQNCKLEEVLASNGKVRAVKTNHGTVSCDNFVNTAGFWARHVGTMSRYVVLHIQLVFEDLGALKVSEFNFHALKVSLHQNCAP